MVLDSKVQVENNLNILLKVAGCSFKTPSTSSVSGFGEFLWAWSSLCFCKTETYK